MPVSHIPRTLKLLREQGWEVDVCERWVGPPKGFKQRKDLFGMFDLIAISLDSTTGVQVCAGSTHASHRRKLLANPVLEIWKWAKGRKALLISWRLSPVKRGAKRKVWTPREEWL